MNFLQNTLVLVDTYQSQSRDNTNFTVQGSTKKKLYLATVNCFLYKERAKHYQSFWVALIWLQVCRCNCEVNNYENMWKPFWEGVGATQLDKHGTFVYVGYNRLLHCGLQLMLVTHGGLQLVYADNNPACQYTQLPIPLLLVHAIPLMLLSLMWEYLIRSVACSIRAARSQYLFSIVLKSYWRYLLKFESVYVYIFPETQWKRKFRHHTGWYLMILL